MSAALPDSPAPGAVPAPARERPLAFVLARGRAITVSADGEIAPVPHRKAGALLEAPGLLVAHVPFTWKRAGLNLPRRAPRLYDLAELFAFVRPAAFAAPTPGGIAAALGLSPAPSPEDEGAQLHLLADRLLTELARAAPEERAHAAQVLPLMGDWAWAPVLASLIGPPPANAPSLLRSLPEWEDVPPRPPPGTEPVSEAAARARLGDLTVLALGTPEPRDTQGDFAAAAAHAFDPRNAEDAPHILALEAGTGVGKTFGYLAPADLWAGTNAGTVWISTYTKNLQRQISQSLAAVYPQADERRARSVVRKGRENYLCLLNLEEALRGRLGPVLGGLTLRWLRHTDDGDMVGGDFPAWLVPYAAFAPNTEGHGGQRLGLTDRRGECIFSACSHYRRCFIEHGSRRTPGADIVVANHAFLLTRIIADAAYRAPSRAPAMPRVVLDEGHHVFEAADEAFAVHLTAREMADLRRWLRGHEEGRRASRGRTLVERVGDLLPDDEAAGRALNGALRAAALLPGHDWAERLREGIAAPALMFLGAIAAQVRARAGPQDAGAFGYECPVDPLTDDVAAAARDLKAILERLALALKALTRLLSERLADDAAHLDTSERQRLESAVGSIELRAGHMLPGWIAMLGRLAGGAPSMGVAEWFAIERAFGRDTDIGMHRHLIDPTAPLADLLYRQAHGVLITSATLFGRGEETDAGESAPDPAGMAARRLGLQHLTAPPVLGRFASPFDYAAQARVLVVRDVNLQDTEQVAAAYRVLFEASGGGGLGVFTAIHRLKAVYGRIREPLEAKGIPLLAQHVDDMDTGTLIDMFRAERDSCLLGTDAVRDGVDVPGRALRLIVFERTPWPRPDLLHKARRDAFGAKAYDEALARARFAQGFGRLIRRADDKGVFVILGAQTPTRLLADLPPAVPIERTGLAAAARLVHDFVGKD